MGINWFPGHMVKARREIAENLKLVDVVLEIVDARAPFSTRNPELETMLGKKPVLMILNRKDLVEAEAVKRWTARLRNEGLSAVAVNSITGEGVKTALQEIQRLYEPFARAMEARNMRRRPPRVMVAGIPNVGKSTFLNKAIGRKVARTGPEPGVTRGKQWVRVEGKIDFLDTPGLMWPRIDSEEQGLKLAALGLVGSRAYREETVAHYIMRFVRTVSPGSMETFYGLSYPFDGDENEMLINIAKRRGYRDDDEPDVIRAASDVISAYRKGLLTLKPLDQ